MSTASPERLLTIEEFHALPVDEALQRDLIRGVVWERPMTRRNRWHAAAEARLAHLLSTWCEDQAEPRGQVFSGEIATEKEFRHQAPKYSVLHFATHPHWLRVAFCTRFSFHGGCIAD